MLKCVFFVAFGLILETSVASKVNVVSGKATINVSYRLDILQIFASYRNQCLCSDVEKVEECYEGHVEVFKRFHGPAHCFGETVLITFRGHIDLLTTWTKCNSTTISAGTTLVINGLSFLQKLGKDAYTFLIENGKATPKLFSVYRKIETNLKKQIGALYYPINEGLTCLEKLFAEILKQFLNRRGKKCENINFKGIMNCGRLLASRVASIFKTALGDCGCVTIANDTYDALAVTACVLYDSLMAILAVLNTMAAIIFEETADIATYLNSYLSVLNTFILGIHETITSLTTGTSKDVRCLLQTVVDQVFSLNKNLMPLLGPVEGIDIPAATIKNNLLKSSDNHKH